ncbi:MAG: OmpA family protein [Gemmatimonadota bacterium]|jgi:chemotaxis protein MotB
MRRNPSILLFAAVSSTLLTGCVKKSTHQVTLDELAAARAAQAAFRDSTQAREAEWREQEAGYREEIARQMAEVERLEAELDDTEARRAELERYFEEARAEVHRLELVLQERGAEARQLQNRLRALAAVEREVRERNQIYEDVIGRFRSLIDAGRLSVSIQRGRMVINLPQDILFRSGSAALATEGRQTLAEVGGVLSELSDRTFQVEGHADNVPIATEQFPSNWELSAARALSVVHLLVGEGVPSANLSGAAYGEFQPVAGNDTADGRRLNRRIEIVMLPNLDVIADSAITG